MAGKLIDIAVTEKKKKRKVWILVNFNVVSDIHDCNNSTFDDFDAFVIDK